MKSIALVNFVLPTVEKPISYLSGESLRDYDIALFNPKLPYLERINFTGGGSCVSIEGGRRLRTAVRHWSSELRSALEAGKTVFVVLNEQETDQIAEGYTTTKTQRNYNTSNLNNYDAIPVKISVRNTRGRQFNVADSAFTRLHAALKDVAQYRVILEPDTGKKIFAAKDGATVAAVVKPASVSGNLVLLPYFDLEALRKPGIERNWSKAAISSSAAIVDQLISIAEALASQSKLTPPPEWISSTPKPNQWSQLDDVAKDIDEQIVKLQERKKSAISERNKVFSYLHLLYESGDALEDVIERSLILLGYKSENYRSGALEIDHIITSPDGFRMIGESEGKENSAIAIAKFRQLESNINEDLQRDEVTQPAKGILFGNGFRFTEVAKREEQFTEKCLVNAKRLGTALIRTSDLYQVVLRVLDNPKDEDFKRRCRDAIETTNGAIVNFPSS